MQNVQSCPSNEKRELSLIVMNTLLYVYMLQATTVVYVLLLLFEELPFTCILFGLAGNGAYFLLLKDFPYFVISSPAFISSIGK